jgi:hypothetical protein
VPEIHRQVTLQSVSIGDLPDVEFELMDLEVSPDRVARLSLWSFAHDRRTTELWHVEFVGLRSFQVSLGVRPSRGTVFRKKTLQKRTTFESAEGGSISIESDAVFLARVGHAEHGGRA